MCSKLTVKTPGRRQWRRSGVFIVNFDYIFAGNTYPGPSQTSKIESFARKVND